MSKETKVHIFSVPLHWQRTPLVADDPDGLLSFSEDWHTHEKWRVQMEKVQKGNELISEMCSRPGGKQLLASAVQRGFDGAHYAFVLTSVEDDTDVLGFALCQDIQSTPNIFHSVDTDEDPTFMDITILCTKKQKRTRGSRRTKSDTPGHKRQARATSNPSRGRILINAIHEFAEKVLLRQGLTLDALAGLTPWYFDQGFRLEWVDATPEDERPVVSDDPDDDPNALVQMWMKFAVSDE